MISREWIDDNKKLILRFTRVLGDRSRIRGESQQSRAEWAGSRDSGIATSRKYPVLVALLSPKRDSLNMKRDRCMRSVGGIQLTCYVGFKVFVNINKVFFQIIDFEIRDVFGQVPPLFLTAVRVSTATGRPYL